MSKQRNAKGQFKSKSEKPQNVAITNNAELIELNQFLVNEIRSMSSIFQRGTNQGLDPRRNIDAECGHPTTEELTVDAYGQLYDRVSLATKVVQILPQESWKVTPIVTEDADPKTKTAFEEALSTIDNQLRGESWFQDEEGSPFWEALARVDELSGIGSYGVLLYGLNDGMKLNEEAIPSEKNELIYITPFEERHATIATYDRVRTSPRFGLPTSYNLTFAATNEGGASSGVGESVVVHWSRVQHVADNIKTSPIFGVPRLRPVLDDILDWAKVKSSSAEMYYKGAFMGIALKIAANAERGDIDVHATKLAMEDYMNEIKRWVATPGLDPVPLAPQVVDPTPQLAAYEKAIATYLGVPQRLLGGSERGELASTQDRITHSERMAFRRNLKLTPRLIVPAIDKMITLGVLPEPDGYSVTWPSDMAADEVQQAEVALKRTEALAKYAQSDSDRIIPPSHFLVEILGVDREDAMQMLTDATFEQADGDDADDEDDNGFNQE